jgi:hypothetical protein
MNETGQGVDRFSLWQCSDGKFYTRLDDAIDHEKFILVDALDLTEEEVERYLRNQTEYSEEKENNAESES